MTERNARLTITVNGATLLGADRVEVLNDLAASIRDLRGGSVFVTEVVETPWDDEAV